MQNEVYPTNFLGTKREQRKMGGGSFQKPWKSSLKVYHEGERKGYMEDKMGETLQFENVARIEVSPSHNFKIYNQKVRIIT